jgi:3-oxoacyl-[acyl-carrier-protein] synthase III
MLENVCERCDIPPERHHSNVEWYGNTGAASSASVLSMRWDKWQPSDDVAVVGVGAGLTWASYWLRFGSTA